MPKHYIYTKLDASWRLDLKDDDNDRYYFIFRSDSFESDLVDHVLEYEDRVVVYYKLKINGDMFKKIVTDHSWSVTSRDIDAICDWGW